MGDVRGIEEEEWSVWVVGLQNLRDFVQEQILLVGGAVQRVCGLISVPQINDAQRLVAARLHLNLGAHDGQMLWRART